MTHGRAAFLAFNLAVRRAADDYYARDTGDDEPTDHYDADHDWSPETRPREGRRPRCRVCTANRSREYRARKKAA